jgi:hypothetical protein
MPNSLDFKVNYELDVLSWYCTKPMWELIQQIYKDWKAVTTKEKQALITPILEEVILWEDNSDITLQLKLGEVIAWIEVYEHYKIHSFFEGWDQVNNELQLMYKDMKVGIELLVSRKKQKGQRLNGMKY